jgi:hypothetical protein
MRKPPNKDPFRDRLVAFARSLTLTHQEQILAGAILLSLLVGSLVMHYRRHHPPPIPAAASPASRQSSSPGE